MIESGRVVALEPGAVWVETLRSSTCGACAARHGCGQGMLNSIGQGHRHHIRVDLSGWEGSAPAVDDAIELSVPDTALVKGALLVYLMPLVAMMAGMAAADSFYATELAAATGAVTGLVAGFGLVVWHARRAQHHPQYRVRVVSVNKNKPLLSAQANSLI